MRRVGLVMALALAMPAVAFAQGTATGADGVTVWVKGVPPAGTTRVDFGDTHAILTSHRVATDVAELHQTASDIVVVQSGTATLVTGGELVDPKSIGPNELVGASIKGGVSRTVGQGDVIEIPPGVAHRYLIPPGGQISYLLIKVTKK